jgi:hypothetical protein
VYFLLNLDRFCGFIKLFPLPLKVEGLVATSGNDFGCNDRNPVLIGTESPCFQGPSTPGNHMTWSVLKWLVLCFMHFMHIKKILTNILIFNKKNRQQRFWPLCVNYTSRVTSDPKRYIGSVSCPHCGGQTSTYGKNPCPYRFSNFENYLFKRQCPLIE